MAASRLPLPGSKLGSCKDDCTHRDCAELRDCAASLCPYCNAPIGYETRYYRNETLRELESAYAYVHANCLEDAQVAE